MAEQRKKKFSRFQKKKNRHELILFIPLLTTSKNILQKKTTCNSMLDLYKI